MGIQGLIPFLEKASTATNISEFAGTTVAVDAYCWLHKGAFSCADKLARGDPCDTFVYYCMKFINMLLSHRIKPILVFDGQKLPAKENTEKKRRENREQNRKKAAELMRMDRGKEAHTFLRRCVDITHEMALQLIQACRSRNVDCIVAPYEADAQLAFFNINNIAEVIVTEDSDLLLFGAKKVFFKMDMQGNGLLIEQDKLHLAMELRPENFSFDKFRYMCILSGCDYLPSLPGIGLVKARRFVNRTSDPDIHRALSRIGAHLNMPQLTVTKEYRDSFMAANFMFKYQPVFDPFKRRIVSLNPLPDNACEEKFKELLDISDLSAEQMCQLAYGNLDPFTLTKLDNWEPGISSKVPRSTVSSSWKNVTIAPHPSIWSENYVPNVWNNFKLKTEPPNALSITATLNVSNDSTKIAPKPITKHSKEEVENAVKQLKSQYQSDENREDFSQKIESPILPASSPKKVHHNPWIKNEFITRTSPSLDKRNVSALSKFAASKAVDSSQNSSSPKIISRYFFSATSPTSPSDKSTTPTEACRATEAKTLQTMYCDRNCDQVESEDSGSFCERSPLKEQNIVTEELSTEPSSPDLNKSACTIRKRPNPFLVENKDKKYRASFPIAKHTDSSSKKQESSFKWSRKTPTDLVSVKSDEITAHRTPPSENLENISNDETVERSPDQDNEDEGFCSPTISKPEKSPLTKKSKCRSVGLTKNSSLKQKSLISMFAFKGPPKLKL